MQKFDGKEKSAIALRFHREKAPEILAAGKGEQAEAILEVAGEYAVPIQESNPSQAATKLDLRTEIPQPYYDLVAEILWFVYRLEEKWKKENCQENSTDRRMHLC